MTITAILFDKDGTLVDLLGTWMPAYHACMTHIAERTGDAALPSVLLNSAGYEPATGGLKPGSLMASGTNQQIIERWCESPAVDALAGIREQLQDILHFHTSYRPAPVTPLGPFFDRLIARGLALGVGTMDSTAGAQETLDHLEVADRVRFVIGFDGVPRAKPAPDMVLAFAQAVRVEPAQVCMVGDSVIDLQMGRNAGCGLVVGVLTGAADRAELASHCDVVLDSIAGLEAVLSD